MKTGWKIIGGFGSHIKSTRDSLIVLHKGKTEEIPLRQLDHLLITGGHNLQSTLILNLIKQGTFISFCESDGTPIGYIRPYLDENLYEMQKLQQKYPSYQIALACAKGAIHDRILTIETWVDEKPDILFTGELDILVKAEAELENLVKLDEIRRLDRLVSDMYYEIFTRQFDKNFGFTRKTERPYKDPINTALSYGYGILSSACTKSLVGAFLDPDYGLLNRGELGLTEDLINCWKTGMIDNTVLSLVKSGYILPGGYECNSHKCVLSEGLLRKIVTTFQETIDLDIIKVQIECLAGAIRGENHFEIFKYR